MARKTLVKKAPKASLPSSDVPDGPEALASLDLEERIQAAARVVQAAGCFPGTKRHVRPITQVANEFGVDHQAVRRRLKGIQ